MAKFELLDRAEQLGKTAALAAIILYVTGFLVQSIYLGSLGISVPFALHPRMVSAGLVLIIFLVVATYNGRLISNQDLFDNVAAGHNRTLRVSSRLTLLAVISIWTSILVQRISDLATYSFWSFALLALVPTATLLAAYLAWQITFGSRSRWIGTVGLLAICWLSIIAALLYKHGFEQGGQVAVWLFTTAGTIGAFDLKLENRFSPLIQVGSQIPIAITLMILFSVAVYPHILPQWGGAVPTRVTITFSKDAAYLSGTVKSALLVEENDIGLYVTDRNLKSSFFIPRSTVSLIRYASE